MNDDEFLKIVTTVRVELDTLGGDRKTFLLVVWDRKGTHVGRDARHPGVGEEVCSLLKDLDDHLAGA